MEHLFMSQLAIHMSSLEKYIFRCSTLLVEMLNWYNHYGKQYGGLSEN